MLNHIRQSNLIEGVDDPAQDQKSLEAWNYLIQRKTLTEDLILTVHRMVMEDLLPARNVGSYRHVWVRVGNRICPDPHEVPYLMREFVTTMEQPTKFEPRRMHVRFEKIHPFVDGNGRVGRLLMWWHQLQLNEEPLLVEYENRLDYYKWFEDQDKLELFEN